MILVDASHTSHSCLLGGVQQVTRNLWRELRQLDACNVVVYDPFQKGWRPADAFEMRVMQADSDTLRRFSGSRKYLLRESCLGHLRRLRLLPQPSQLARGAVLLCPEVLLGDQTARIRQAREQTGGKCVAIFHDAIVMRMPEAAPEKTLAGFPAYLKTLLEFDAIAAVSEASRRDLLDYWKGLGFTRHPPVEVISPGIDPPANSGPESDLDPPLVLCVSTIEGRKNHLSLLNAAEQLWDEGLAFRLMLIGTAVRGSSEACIKQIRALQEKGHPVTYAGRVEADVVTARYRQAAFTVYPSLFEGYGLPVLESLSYGKPCVTSAGGGLAEVTRGGGCVVVDPPQPDRLAAAMRSLITDPERLHQLKQEAAARPIRTWANYARDLRSWIGSL